MIMIIMVILEIMMVIITILVIIVIIVIIIIINKRRTGDGMLLQFQFIISTKQTDCQFYQNDIFLSFRKN